MLSEIDVGRCQKKISARSLSLPFFAFSRLAVVAKKKTHTPKAPTASWPAVKSMFLLGASFGLIPRSVAPHVNQSGRASSIIQNMEPAFFDPRPSRAKLFGSVLFEESRVQAALEFATLTPISEACLGDCAHTTPVPCSFQCVVNRNKTDPSTFLPCCDDEGVRDSHIWGGALICLYQLSSLLHYRKNTFFFSSISPRSTI